MLSTQELLSSHRIQAQVQLGPFPEGEVEDAVDYGHIYTMFTALGSLSCVSLLLTLTVYCVLLPELLNFQAGH